MQIVYIKYEYNINHIEYLLNQSKYTFKKQFVYKKYS